MGETLKSRGSSASKPGSAGFSVTVGLPVYNDAARVRFSVDSVMNQTWQGDIRLLIVDDGSTDATPKILEELAADYANVTVMRLPANRGRAAARNMILKHADTEYLAWIDSDDVWYPEKLQKQFDALRARPDDLGVLCTCPYKLISVDDGSEELLKRPRIGGEQLRNCLESTLYPFLWSMLGRTQTFRDVGEFDERLKRRQDFEFFLRFLKRGGLVVSTDPDFPLCEYRRSDVGRSGWTIASANRVIWRKHRRVYFSFGRAYAYNRRAAQHSLCARFFKANGQKLPEALFQLRRRYAEGLSLAFAIGSGAAIKRLLIFIPAEMERVADAKRRAAFVKPFSLPRSQGPIGIDLQVVGEQAADPCYSGVLRNLTDKAEEALDRGPYSVVDKGYAKVGTLQDYWFPAPYWWPDPQTLNGRPYVRNPDRRLPGTQFYEAGSERYDRARLQRLCDDTFVLALAHHITGKAEYGEHARQLLHRWFLNAATRMTPHLKYAEVKLGHSLDHGSGRGIVQTQAFWYLLDAVRLLKSDGALGKPEYDAIRLWFAEYLAWLLHSRQGRWARARMGFHGAYYELQTAAIAAFVDDLEAFGESIYRSKQKIHYQFEPLLVNEAGTARTAKVSRLPFTLMAWTNLHDLTRGCGKGLWELPSVNHLIKAGCEHLFAEQASLAAHEQAPIASVLPILAAYEEFFGETDLGGALVPQPSQDDSTLSFEGVRPFWMLGTQRKFDLPKRTAVSPRHLGDTFRHARVQ